MAGAPQRAARQPREQGWDNVAYIGAFFLLALGAVVWATGELSGLVASGHPTGTSLARMGQVIIHLLAHPAHPARAWPHQVRSALPGPVLFYFVLAILLAVASALGVVIHRLIKGMSPDRSQGSKWASARDLRSLIVAEPVAGRLVLGRVGARLVAAEERQSVIVLGPTQSMKTSGLAIPAILEWQGPVVATSIKTDLLQNTLDARRAQGTSFVFDPTACTGLKGSAWSPLAFCSDWHGAQKTASWLCDAARRGSGGLSDADFWYAAAAKLLAPLLFAAAISRRTMSDVVRWVNLQEEKEVIEALTAAGEQTALDSAIASFKREPRQKSSVYTTTETVLSAYEDPVVAASAQRCDITPARLLDGSFNTLYVVAPSHEQRRLRPLFETLLHTVISEAFEMASRHGGRLDPPLLLVLDEAANIAPLRDLDSLASTAASHGIQLVSIFQDLAQIAARYGDGAQTVVNNHRAKIFTSGISDTQTLEYASRLLGDEEVLQSSTTRGIRGSKSTTESTALRSIAPAHVLRGIRPGEGILVYGHLPPARLILRPWFKEKRFRRRAT